ncbi:MAG: Dabb family protein [Akkermansiaceae bacterium]
MEHHVYFWLKEEKKNTADCEVFEKGLAALFDIEHVAGGVFGKSSDTPARPVTDKSFDYALSMKFDSLENHNTYQDHPEHDVFVDQFKDWWDKVLVMDVG